jgi:hypothetical protein
MTQKLRTLRANLNALRRRRRGERWARAHTALGLSLLLALSAAFLADFLLDMDRLQRCIALGLSAAGLVWAIRRFTLPWLGWRETELDLALSVEKERLIDSDLVAALQFERQFEEGRAAVWGSQELREGVVDSVADLAGDLDVFEGLTGKRPRWRLTALGAAALIVASGVLCFPGHAAAFFERCLLRSRHYPTRTVIEEVAVNGLRLDRRTGDGTPPSSAYGQPVRFEARASGALPPGGRVEVRSQGSDLSSRVELKPGADGRTFAGELPRLTEPAVFQLYLGDAWTDPQTLLIIPLPVVELRLEPEPPAYARAGATPADAPPGARQISVIEGSRVAVEIHCINKSLSGAVLAVGDAKVPLGRSDESGRTWSLKPEGTPLASLAEPISFEVQVTDQDGLGLPTPIRASIGLKPDRLPRVAAAAVTQKVLPAARPMISYGASDDYGVARLSLRRQVVRMGGAAEESLETILEVPAGQEARTLRGTHALDLAPLKLKAGDRLTIAVEALDFRGTLPGKPALSEPLVFDVTDERGVLAAMAESDERSAEKLDAIIQRQLGIGETR